jgi:hypothetical protein
MQESGPGVLSAGGGGSIGCSAVGAALDGKTQRRSLARVQAGNQVGALGLIDH